MNLKKRAIFQKMALKSNSLKKLIYDYLKYNIFNCNKQLTIKTF